MILNTTQKTYAQTFQNVHFPSDFAAEFSVEIAGHAATRRISAHNEFGAVFSIEARGRARTQTSLNFYSRFRGEITGHAKLALSTPAPIINEIAPNAFQKQFYAARLLDNLGNEIDFTNASIDAPKNFIGKRVSINVAKKDLSLITKAKKYTFQIGTRETPLAPVEWETILENAELTGRNFSLGWNNAPNDTLSFGVVKPSPINRYPLENAILYDSRKTTVESGEIEKIPIEGGGFIGTGIFAQRFLTLYDLFRTLKKYTGYSAIETNIPNFEITRADFPVTRTIGDSIGAIIGIFEPVFFTVGNTLWIIDKTAALPENFAPRAITCDEFSNWNMTVPESELIEGLMLVYVDSNTNADFHTDRQINTFEETGQYGNADYSRTDILRIYRDWFKTGDAVPLKSELIREVHSTYDAQLILIGRETNDHIYDAQGKRKSSARTVEGLVPNLANSGTPALLTTRRETQNIYYKTDQKNPKRFIQDRILTQIRGLVAVDAENTYFDEPFKQDLVDAHRAGNLAEDMTTEFIPVKTISESLTSLGNGQFGVRVSETDHLRNTTVNTLSEPKTGDASLSGIGGRTRRILILREGLLSANRQGLAAPDFSVGELPLELARNLAKRVLARKLAGSQEGTASVIGYDKSIERGVMFRVVDRENNSYGKFIAEGYRVQIDALAGGVKINTEIDVSEL